MPIDREKIAQRMLHFRKTLGISQAELAKIIGATNQNTISLMETKAQFSVDTFISLVNYFSEHFHLDNLLTDNFTVVQIKDEKDRMSLHNAITTRQLIDLKNDLSEKIDRITDSIRSSEEDSL
ncbi:helix-turn-helix domain-containing protein [Maribacter polysaccharolyticus]|uniref:helix-turn-helix domain-containing protein n=1 Tax=Maribacter polysaccharolyticus TaxID=3020831 RepID=UPI00237FD207|nr:helix-turn-helix transcriptional regulator [Maribacter polysaccharolyticus]MDE3744032.1 helix-turn-helix transcriptional regulator [Maribacter polysaccharolyticus]